MSFDERRAGWAITVIAWCLYRLTPPNQRRDIAGWMRELGDYEVKEHEALIRERRAAERTKP